LAPPSLDLSIVLPSYNDGDRLRPVVDAAVSVVSRLRLDAEVIVVLDGSTDHSTRTLAGLPASTVKVIKLPSNQGKGAALVHGFAASRGQLVGYLDADGDLDPEVIGGLVDAIGEHRTWCAAGSTWDPTAQVITTPGRRALSAAYRAAVRQLFQLDVSNTQCGAKLFHRDALAQLLPLARERRFALDLELLALGRRLGLGPVVEVPVRLRRPAGARMRIDPRATARAAVDTVRLWARLAETPLTALPVPATDRPSARPAAGVSRPLAGARSAISPVKKV
jgi:glycosyltransferase involved in cell wall biosynthesis